MSCMKYGALDINHLKNLTQHRLVDWLKIMHTSYVSSCMYVTMYTLISSVCIVATYVAIYIRMYVCT